MNHSISTLSEQRPPDSTQGGQIEKRNKNESLIRRQGLQNSIENQQINRVNQAQKNRDILTRKYEDVRGNHEKLKRKLSQAQQQNPNTYKIAIERAINRIKNSTIIKLKKKYPNTEFKPNIGEFGEFREKMMFDEQEMEEAENATQELRLAILQAKNSVPRPLYNNQRNNQNNRNHKKYNREKNTATNPQYLKDSYGKNVKDENKKNIKTSHSPSYTLQQKSSVSAILGNTGARSIRKQENNNSKKIQRKAEIRKREPVKKTENKIMNRENQPPTTIKNVDNAFLELNSSIQKSLKNNKKNKNYNNIKEISKRIQYISENSKISAKLAEETILYTLETIKNPKYQKIILLKLLKNIPKEKKDKEEYINAIGQGITEEGIRKNNHLKKIKKLFLSKLSTDKKTKQLINQTKKM